MNQWLKENLIVLLLNALVMVGFGLGGYVWTKQNEENQRQFNEQNDALTDEIKERKEQDDKLMLMIDSKIGKAQFEEFKGSVEYIKADVSEMRGDIKELLKRK